MKYAFVTGGSRGIGKAICLRLAADGYNILLNYVANDAAAEATAAEIKNLNVEVALLKFDVTDREKSREAISQWFANNSGSTIAVLVNNSGIRKDNLMLWMKDDEWDSVVDTSLGGFYNVTKPVLEEMIKIKGGRIINIVSLSGLKGLPGQTNYSAAKAAVIGATKALSQELGRRKITVNAVAPGFIVTEMTADIDEKQYKAHIPLQRFGQPEEVAALVSFLASDGAAYITGEIISVSGGLF